MRASTGQRPDRSKQAVWYITSLVLTTVWAVAGCHRPGADLVVIAGALLILSVVMSLLLLVLINNRGKTWTPENRPEDWKEQTNRWDRSHYIRVAVIIAAFIAAFTLLAAALARARGPRPRWWRTIPTPRAAACHRTPDIRECSCRRQPKTAIPTSYAPR